MQTVTITPNGTDREYGTADPASHAGRLGVIVDGMSSDRYLQISFDGGRSAYWFDARHVTKL